MSEEAVNIDKAELMETIAALRPAIEEMTLGQGEPFEFVLAQREALIRQPKEL